MDVDHIDVVDVESRNCTNDDDAVAVFFVALAALHFLIFFDKCAKNVMILGGGCGKEVEHPKIVLLEQWAKP